MTEPSADTAAQLQEYEAQLADVQVLFTASPEDESLLALKSDLEELLALTRSSLRVSKGKQHVTQPQPHMEMQEDIETLHILSKDALAPGNAVNASVNDLTDDVAPTPDKKKKLKVKDFQIPEHLVPLESDTTPETNRKHRSIKALKNKWRERKREAESAKKQLSWQSFQSKTKRKRNNKSIFATQDGVNAKVGVISAGSMTEYGERKRHK